MNNTIAKMATIMNSMFILFIFWAAPNRQPIKDEFQYNSKLCFCAHNSDIVLCALNCDKLCLYLDIYLSLFLSHLLEGVR